MCSYITTLEKESVENSKRSTETRSTDTEDDQAMHVCYHFCLECQEERCGLTDCLHVMTSLGEETTLLPTSDERQKKIQPPYLGKWLV